MKKILSILLFTITSGLLFFACTKVADLPYYPDGTMVTLTANKSAVTSTVADSSTNVLSFTWTSPNYASDATTWKYILEIDSTGKSFVQSQSKTVTGTNTTSFTGRELNSLLLNLGFKVGVPVSIDARVISSYGNNNERYVSNIQKISITPFSDPSVLATEKTSVTGTAATSTNHSNTFTWSPAFKGYTGTVTYAIQYDSATKNFASPQEIAAGNQVYTKSLNEDEMNTTALSEGVAMGGSGKIEYRIKATTASGSVSYSNVVSVTIGTFSPVPANLYIVGDATPGGWNNPVPVPSQQFTKIDAYTFRITLGLTAGGSYLFLPVNGDWSHKYGGATDGTVAGGGILLKDGAVPGSNTPAPAVSGVYRIDVNFQTNRYTVTQVTVPANLYIVGDATPGGWSNPVPTPTQQFTKTGPASFGMIINLTAGASYLFLPLNGDWAHKYGGSSATGGVLLADGAVPGSNTPAPATSGLYKIVVDFATNSYSVTPYTGTFTGNLFIVGDATPGGWNNPVPVPSQQFTRITNAEFDLTLPLTAGASYLFLPTNGDWTHKFGGATNGVGSPGILLEDGAVPGSNTPAPSTSGTYNIRVNFANMTYKVQ